MEIFQIADLYPLVLSLTFQRSGIPAFRHGCAQSRKQIIIMFGAQLFEDAQT